MNIYRLDDNYNRVNTREELIELLKGYKGILTNPMINYLNSLIELDFSVIREYIKEEDRKSLAELEIYKKVAIYNIYNRALKLFKENKIKCNFSGNEDGLEYFIYAILDDTKNVEVFNFDYKGFHNDEMSDEYKTMEIGNISLYQTLESKELKEAELDRVMAKLERLYDEKNPYRSRPGFHGGPSPRWTFEHKEEIKRYEKMFTDLDSKKELTDEEKREIEITKQIHDFILEDYGLTNKSFEEDNKPISSRDKSLLQKTLVNKQTNLIIKNHIRYI